MPPSDWLSWDFCVQAVGFWFKDTQRLYHLGLFAAGLIGFPLLYSRTRSANQSAAAALEQAKTALKQAEVAAARHEEQTSADRERRISESFAKAGEQLGSDKLEARLIAIYTLERIARESEREYRPIMETLTAYVREHAPWPPRQGVINPFVELQVSGGVESASKSTPAEQPGKQAEPASVEVHPATDIQAVLTVLGRRYEAPRNQHQAAERRLGLDLKNTDLRGADLGDAHLEGASLRYAHLEDADLEGAHLEGADLEEAVGLTQGQLAEAFGDAKTKVANELRPAHWPPAAAKEPDNAE